MMAFEATVGLAAGAAVAAFFSPCAYTLLPGYVSYYVASTDGRQPLGGAVLRGIAAACGVVAAFVGLSAAAVLVGGALEPVLPLLEVLVGVALVGLGVVVLFRGGFHVTVPLPERRTDVAGFGLFGALYATAGAGCTAPYFLAVVLQALTFSPGGTLAVLGTFAGTFGALLVSVTVLTALGHGISAGRVAGVADRATRIAGVILVVAGAGQVYIGLQ